MSENTCQQCSAQLKGLVCEYCGSLARLHLNREEERDALAEYHNILLKLDSEAQINLLQNGFIPDAPDVLIEAGIRCVPLIDIKQTADDVVEAAYRRLQAIMIKLRLLPSTADITQALQEFERVTNEYNQSDRKLNIVLSVLAIIIVIVCLGLIVLALT